ncbi:MAG: hypothetical protein Q8P25_02250, partial [Candidatus Curtissbacteria bacterium]|nr:hypothetical protein [Candidatus Curtissbacteria bacterium]
MENQINVGDQNTQKVEKTSVSNPIQIPEKSKLNYWMILTIALFILLVVGGIAYYFNTQKNRSSNLNNQPQNPSPTIVSQVTPSSSRQSEKLVKLADAWSLGTITYSSPKIGITFEYPSYFEVQETNIQKANQEWADQYKN